MSGAMVVGAAGAGLIGANLFAGPQRAQLAPLWSGTGDLSGAHTVAKAVGTEVLAVGALTLWAGNSSTGAKAALAILGCLWVVWLVRYSGGKQLSGIGGVITSAGKGVLSDPFRIPGTVSPPVNTGPARGSGRTPTGAGGQPYSQQIPGLPLP